MTRWCIIVKELLIFYNDGAPDGLPIVELRSCATAWKFSRDICLPSHFRQLLKSPLAGPVGNFGVHQELYKGSSRECSTRVIFKKGLLVAELEAKRCYKAVAWGGKLTSHTGGSLYLPRQVPTGSIHIPPRILSQSMTPPLVNLPSCCILREFCILCSSQQSQICSHCCWLCTLQTARVWCESTMHVM